ncbi:MAG: hypothetical protein NTY95_03415, partial [Bacteroidia bacterium]|nr:hypothetical protein [Bacteroidia bacterium]
ITVSENIISSPGDTVYKNQAISGILSIKTYYETKFLEQGKTINYLAFRLEKYKFISRGWEKTK